MRVTNYTYELCEVNSLYLGVSIVVSARFGQLFHGVLTKSSFILFKPSVFWRDFWTKNEMVFCFCSFFLLGTGMVTVLGRDVSKSTVTLIEAVSSSVMSVNISEHVASWSDRTVQLRYPVCYDASQRLEIVTIQYHCIPLQM